MVVWHPLPMSNFLKLLIEGSTILEASTKLLTPLHLDFDSNGLLTQSLQVSTHLKVLTLK